MEQVLYKVHARLLTTTNRYLNYASRRTIEGLTLIGAMTLTCVLIVLHRTFVSHSNIVETNCILKLLQDTNLYNTSSSSIDIPILTRKFDIIVVTIADPHDIYYRHVKKDSFNSSWWDNFAPTFTPLQEHCAKDKNAITNDIYPQYCYSFLESSLKNHVGGVRQYTASSKDLNVRRGSYRYFFALQRGTLMLTQEREPPYHRNFTVLDVTITPDMSCLSQKKVSTILTRWTSSFDVVVMNWAISAFQGSGYLYNTVSRELFNLNYAADFVTKKGTEMSDMGRRESYTNKANYLISAWRGLKKYILSPLLTMISARLAEYLEAMGLWMHLEELLSSVVGDPTALFSSVTAVRATGSVDWYALSKALYQYSAFRIGVLFSTSFLFFISTTLINYILRETQERMLRFTFLLQYHITHRMPFGLLVITHVIGSLVFVPILMGIYFFLFEFFSDQLLAFLVLLVVWMGEVFSVLSLRSHTNIKYFPKIFACYFFLFHVYFFSFPFGFCYVALSATTLFVLHAMIHFWNVYEVPAFESGRISPVRPRMSSGGNPLVDTNAVTADGNLNSANNVTSVNENAANHSNVHGDVIRNAFSEGNVGRGRSASDRAHLFRSSDIHAPTVTGSSGTSTARRPRANSSSGNQVLPAHYMPLIPASPLTAASSTPMSTQQLQQAFVRSQQQQIARQRQSQPPASFLSAQKFPSVPTPPLDLSPLQPKRQRSMTDPGLEESSAANAVMSMFSRFNPSNFLSSASQNPSEDKMKNNVVDIKLIEQLKKERKISGDAYRDEANPDSELSAAAFFQEDDDQRYFSLMPNTRSRKNSASTPGRNTKDTAADCVSPEDNKNNISSFSNNSNTSSKSDRLARYYPSTFNKKNDSNHLLGVGDHETSRRGRADSLGSNSSAGSVGKKVSANIYETLEARRLRLELNNSSNSKASVIVHAEGDIANNNVSDKDTRMLSFPTMISRQNKNDNIDKSNKVVNDVSVFAASESYDLDDVTGNFYD